MLLSRAAPNHLTLQTPWGGAAGVPIGPVHTQPEFRSYLGSLRPLLLGVPVPPNGHPGLYMARLSGPLFVCNTRAVVCLRRDVNVAVNVAVNVRVLPVGQTSLPMPLALTDAVLQPCR
ncbi:hypothetical protein ACFFLM_17200 [Deinococcus oregonensis]|uniref:Uncharacterized protein n=1 Tax=Deinococcus oregonensis TaxID=1805970 RepID=A0ABV6B1X8_9DEIO